MPEQGDFAESKAFFQYWLHLAVALPYLASCRILVLFPTMISFILGSLVWLWSKDLKKKTKSRTLENPRLAFAHPLATQRCSLNDLEIFFMD